jgi:ATP-dependent Clp protease protease subunit
MVAQVVQFLMACDLKASEGYCTAPTISMSTDGGYVSAALAIHDILKARPAAHIIVTGTCYSAGTIILQGATKRSSTKNSQFLIHFGAESNASKSELAHNRKVEKVMQDIMVARTGKSKTVVSRWMAAETFFMANEALEAGLIDEVV